MNIETKLISYCHSGLDPESSKIKFWISAFAGMTFLFHLFFANPASAATEFVTAVDTGGATSYSYSSLNAWVTGLATDLTAATTQVFAGTLDNTVADNARVYLCRSGAYQTHYGDVVHATGTQILIDGITGSATETSGDTWYSNDTCTGGTTYFTISDGGDSAIAVAKLQATTGAADITAATVDGFTTSATNYIKIWTSTSENYRHDGKWNTGKYRLKISTGVALTISEENARIQGLQIESGDETAIYVNGMTGTSDIQISQNIIKGNATSSKYGIYFYATGSSSSAKVWNNIIYDYSGTSSSGIYWNDADWTPYIYNNTIQNCAIGLNRGNDAAHYTKNNLISATDAFNGTFTDNDTNNDYNAISENNGSEVAIGSHGKYNQTFAFEDEANDDFHLDSSDTTAKNSGANLYADANIAVTTDVDNNARPNSATTFDIGADENVAKIYRSVGPSATTALTTGTSDGHSNHLSISSLTATFEYPLSDSIGVGDAIQYDDDNDGDIDASDSIVFIDKRYSSVSYRVKTASGGAPTATAAADIDWSIFRSYTSLFNAEAGTENSGIDADLSAFDAGNLNLTTNNLQWNFACYANGTTADTGGTMNLTGWTSSKDNYMKIYTPTRIDEVGTSQRHSGKWDSTKYVDDIPTSFGIQADGIQHLKIDGLQIDSRDSTNASIELNTAYAAGTDTFLSVSNCIIWGNNGTYAGGIVFAEADLDYGYAYNNIIYDFTNATGAKGIISATGTVASIYIYNNTIYNCNAGIITDAGTVIAKNNIFDNCTSNATGTYAAGTGYNATDDASIGYTVTGGSTGDRLSQTFSYVDEANDDFHLLPSDAGAKNYGTDLSNDAYIPFNNDVDDAEKVEPSSEGSTFGRYSDVSNNSNFSRPRGTTWDIGADEVITKIYRSVGPGEDEVLENGATNHLNISGSTATFDNALGDDVGVGDVLEYDDDNDGDIDANDSLAFITGRTSSTVFTIKTSTGGVPTAPAAADEIHWNINRAYTSLSNWESGTENTLIDNDLYSFDAGNRDIAANSEQWYVACYAHGTTADTTAVTFSGWTTSPTNYIKIYTPTATTEVGASQRHNGKWNTNKYRISVTDSSAISNSINYLQIDGLQIESVSPTTTARNVINLVDSQSGQGDIRVSNSILKGANNSTNWQYGIYMTGTTYTGTVKIWNNLAYNYYSSVSMASDIYANATYAISYVYNNTVLGNRYGYRQVAGVVVVKNCIAQDAVDGFIGTFDPASDYNLSDVAADAPGTNSKNSTTVTFSDETNYDYHLASADTNAKDYGVDLSQDLIWQMMSVDSGSGTGMTNGKDIDSAGRPLTGSGLSWDIGADEVATAIYRSVGPSATSALATGASNHLNISGSTATFDTAPGTSIGVGDVLEYDANGDAGGVIDSVAIITGRTSETVYTIKSYSGRTPTAQTSADEIHWNIFRASASLSGAETGTENSGLTDAVEHFDITWSVSSGKNLLTYNEQWNIAAYANGTTADSTAVTIDSWTTGEKNYIKVYTPTAATEVGISQRHQGRWDNWKYRLVISDAMAITLNNNYTRLEGLQISLEGTANWQSSIYSAASSLNGVKISQNIIKSTGGNYRTGIALQPTASVDIQIWNNLVYDFSGTNGSGITTSGSDNSIYVYNNTIDNCVQGLGTGYSDTLAKNNLTSVIANNYSGTFYEGSDYNAGNASDVMNTTGSPGANNKVSQTFSFADSVNDDFHLSFSDTGARNSGTDLTSDTYLPFSTDIDGHTRSTSLHSGAWDIGADEGATAVYFSAGQNVTSHETGAGNVDVDAATKTATFTVAQTAINMGVGDVIDYDSDNKKCYITGKTSTTVWTCLSATGGAPTDSGGNVVVNSVSHAYASLSLAEAGASSLLGTSDLWTNNYQLNIPCYYDSGADTTAITVDGWTTGVPNYIKIYTPDNTSTEINQSQRHQGKYSTNHYYLVPATGIPLTISDEYVRIEGLQLNTADDDGIYINGATGLSDIQLSKNIIKGSSTASTYGIYLNSTGSASTAKISNNIIYDFSATGTGSGIYWNDADWTPYIYNNTIQNCAIGLNRGNDTAHYTKNNLIDATDAFNGTFTDNDTNNDYNAISENNGSEVAIGTNGHYNHTFTYVDSTGDDFHLELTDTGARNLGTSLSTDSGVAFSIDIDGNGRGTWDIGADEGSVEMEATVQASSGDYSTLSAWQTGMVTNLVANTTFVFSGTRTGTMSDNAPVTGATSGATATVVHATATQILLENISGTFQSGEQIQVDGSNYFTTSDAGNPAIAVAKIDGAWASADTTAVTVTGWTTGLTNYVKIYTTTTARHQGKWDTSKYRLTPTNWDYAVLVYSSYVTLDGLQIQSSLNNDDSLGGVNLGTSATSTHNILKNSIIKHSGSTGNFKKGITFLWSSDAPFYIYNNIIYDFNGTGHIGIDAMAQGSSYPSYIYNNTIYNCTTGIDGADEANLALIKNNLIQNCKDAFVGGTYFYAGSDYNLTDNTSGAPGANSKQNTKVKFLDENGDDFRLAAGDTGAKNSGTDLSADTYLAFTTDIASKTRSGSWDIGAFEGVTDLFRSVGVTATALDSGNPDTLTISGSTATFSADTPTNVGVGDVIQYQVSGTYYIAFIYSRTDARNFTVYSSAGAAPTATGGAITAWNIYRAYTQGTYGPLYNWEAQDENDTLDDSVENFDTSTDLVTNGTVMNVACYGDGADTTAVTINGWTTGASNYIKIYTPVLSSEVGVSQRHSGKWDDTKYRLTTTASADNQTSLYVQDEYVRIDGLQISHDHGAYPGGYDINISYQQFANTISISNNIIKQIGGTGGYGIMAYDVDTTAYIYNNIIYDAFTGIYAMSGSVAYVYNNTVTSCSTAGIVSSVSSIIAKNNISYSNTDNYNGAFNGTYSANNLSGPSSSDAPGSSPRNAVTVTFADGASDDFHLANADAGARNYGTNLSADSNLSFSDDVDGELRNVGGTWDIGADEVGGSSSTLRINGGVKVQGGVKVEQN